MDGKKSKKGKKLVNSKNPDSGDTDESDRTVLLSDILSYQLASKNATSQDDKEEVAAKKAEIE